MMSFPIEIFTGQIGLRAAFRGLGLQWMWILALHLLYRQVWRRGLKRFSAVGA
jgi:ABC-2 type transport system permease protein